MAASPLRKVLIAIGVLLVVLIAGLGILVATFDPNTYKGLAIDWMQKERQRTLVIEGPVKLSIFPKLAVQLSGVTLSERGKVLEFMHVDEASLSVAVMPLLRKRLQVDGISAKGVRAVWRRAADGSSNIDDLLDKKTPDEPEATGGPQGEALAFDVSGVKFEDLKLTVDDALAGIAGAIAVKSFTTGRLADQAESPIEVDAQVDLARPALSGHVSGKTKLRLDLKARATALRDMELAWVGDAFGLKALDTKLTGALAHDGAAGTVAATDLDVRIGATLGALRLEGSQVAVKSFGYDPAKKHLSLEQLKVRVAGKQDGQPLKLDLDWPKLAVDGTSLSGGPVTGELSLKGPLALDATFKSAAPRGNFERVEVPGFETTLKGSSGPRRIAGTVRSNLALDVAAQSLAIEGLAAKLSIEEPSLQPLALDATGRATASAKAATWKLGGAINTNPFDTEGKLGLADKPLSFDVSANFKALDLNRLLPSAPPAAAASSAAPGKAGAGDAAPVDLSALKSAQGRLSLRAGTFAYRQYRATNLVTDATLRGGTLKVAPFSAELWRGRVDLVAQADAGSNRVAAKGAAENIDVQALLKDVADKDLLEGRGRVALDVATTGRTVGEFKSHLDGSASLQLHDGAIKGINLAQRLRQARAALSMKADAATKASTTEKTDFSELSASFTLANGIARSNDLTVKSPFIRLGGEGLVDIPKSRIDYTVRATVADTSKGQGGADLAELRGLTVPVRLTGPLDAVQWDIRWSAVAADVLKSEVGRQVEDRLKDKLNERLGLPPRSASAPEGAASRPEDVLKDKLRRLLK